MAKIGSPSAVELVSTSAVNTIDGIPIYNESTHDFSVSSDVIIVDDIYTIDKCDLPIFSPWIKMSVNIGDKFRDGGNIITALESKSRAITTENVNKTNSNILGRLQGAGDIDKTRLYNFIFGENEPEDIFDWFDGKHREVSGKIIVGDSYSSGNKKYSASIDIYVTPDGGSEYLKEKNTIIFEGVMYDSYGNEVFETKLEILYYDSDGNTLATSHTETIGGYTWVALSNDDMIGAHYEPSKMIQGKTYEYLSNLYIIKDGNIYRATNLEDNKLDLTFETTEILKTKIGTVNRLRALDDTLNSYTSSASPLTYKIKADEPFNGMALHIRADTVTYTVRSANGDVLQSDTIAIDPAIDNDGLLGDTMQTKAIQFGTMYDANCTVEINAVYSGEVRLGHIGLYRFTSFGSLAQNLTLTNKRYAGIETDDYGKVLPSRKPVVPILNGTVYETIDKYPKFATTVRELMIDTTKVIVFIGDEGESKLKNSLTIIGLLTKGDGETIVEDGELQGYVKIPISIMEVV